MVLLAGAPQGAAAEPVVLSLGTPAGVDLVYREAVTGEGTLRREAADGQEAVTLPLRVLGESRRRWRFASAGTELEAEAVSQVSQLRLEMGDQAYDDPRPWRSFRLSCDRGGRIFGASVFDPRLETDEPAAELGPEPPLLEGLPIDLDLGELLCLIELGLLPPRPLAPGESWRAEPGDAAASPLAIEGRLRDADAATATLETSFETAIPDSETSLDEVRSSGRLQARTEVVFDRVAGRVERAGCPLTLVVEFRRPGRAGRLVATLELRLELAVERVDPAASPAAGRE